MITFWLKPKENRWKPELVNWINENCFNRAIPPQAVLWKGTWERDGFDRDKGSVRMHTNFGFRTIHAMVLHRRSPWVRQRYSYWPGHPGTITNLLRVLEMVVVHSGGCRALLCIILALVVVYRRLRSALKFWYRGHRSLVMVLVILERLRHRPILTEAPKNTTLVTGETANMTCLFLSDLSHHIIWKYGLPDVNGDIDSNKVWTCLQHFFVGFDCCMFIFICVYVRGAVCSLFPGIPRITCFAISILSPCTNSLRSQYSDLKRLKTLPQWPIDIKSEGS